MGKIKNKKLNRKGFTLIELLAVIVILAILILLAMPSVLSIMEKSRKNALVTEAESIINAAKTAYTSDVTSGTARGDKTYEITDEDLGRYLDKDLTNYSGKVLIEFQEGTSKAKYYISISDGAYKLCGESGKINADAYVSTGETADDISSCAHTVPSSSTSSSSSNS